MLVGEHEPHARHCRSGRLFKRIALDGPTGNRHQSQDAKPIDRRCRNSARGELGRVESLRRAAQQRQCLLLSHSQSHRRLGVEALRGQGRHADGSMRRSASLPWLRDLHQAVALQVEQCAVRLPLFDNGINTNRPSVIEQLQDGAPRSPFGQHARPAKIRQTCVPLALHPGARRHRRGDRFTDPARIVLSHPRGQGEHVRR